MSLPSPSHASQVLRFGLFEADLSTGELRKNGVKIRLQEQPFQILAFLLARPGELVTRQDLRDKLWSNDTFVISTIALILQSTNCARRWETQLPVRVL